MKTISRWHSIRFFKRLLHNEGGKMEFYMQASMDRDTVYINIILLCWLLNWGWLPGLYLLWGPKPDPLLLAWTAQQQQSCNHRSPYLPKWVKIRKENVGKNDFTLKYVWRRATPNLIVNKNGKERGKTDIVHCIYFLAIFPFLRALCILKIKSP